MYSLTYSRSKNKLDKHLIIWRKLAQAMMNSSLHGEVEADVEIRAPAKKFFHMFAVRPQDVSKASPETVQGCRVQGGEMGRVGTLITWNYVLDGKPNVAKERIEAVDPKKNMIKLKVIEGDVTEEFKSFLITIQVTPKKEGPGGVVKLKMTYERIDENVAHPETLLQTGIELFKDIDEMLLLEE
ncbi:Polyketide cyclase/dehydrase and lipid transport superfamily protein [Raphanus sativus]|uniref:MLP-like protein 43 n=1 Tax=Raphanus sativus TaxID=3726 RepID=A0A6J0JGA0_RAPSA|nr:MLP-like protein 43 [Raphanus sativus]KAJ4889678.1 Polyketide cyclase/dehydrase and lipid transport superfamily protein [Raphanus sativus]